MFGAWNKEIMSDEQARKAGSFFAGLVFGLILPVVLFVVFAFFSWMYYGHGGSPSNIDEVGVILPGFLGIFIEIALFFMLRKMNSALAAGILSSAVVLFLGSPFIVLFLLQ